MIGGKLKAGANQPTHKMHIKFLKKLPTNQVEADAILQDMRKDLMDMSDEVSSYDGYDEDKEKEMERTYNLQEGRIMIAERIFDLMFGDPDQI